VHDIANLEGLGLPGAFVATTEFAQAAEAQGQALGFHPRAVFIAHPIQDRTEDELRALADGALAAIVSALAG
jgi:hypothetical protein